jgi:tetraacyldisaccharide 4'-kinase
MDLNRRGVVNYALLPIAGFFYVLSKIRKAFYRLGIFRVNQFNIPIVVVGNITVGGSGKTPVVIKLVEYLQQHGKKVGVVSGGMVARMRQVVCWLIQIPILLSQVTNHY